MTQEIGSPAPGSAPGSTPARDLTILMVGIATVGLQALMLSPMLPDMAAALHATAREIGFATGAYGLGVALSALIAAPQLGRWRKVPALRTAFLIMACGLALCGIAWDWRVLVGGQALTGLAAGIVLPGTYALAAELSAPEARSRAIGKVIFGWSVAMVAGIPLAALFADLVDWRGTFATVSAACLFMAMLLGRISPTSGTIVTNAASYAEALRVPGMKLCLVATFAYMIGFYQTYTFVGDYVRHLHDAGAWLGGVVAASYGLGFGAAVLFNAWQDRQGPVRLMALALLAVGLNYLILPFALLEFWSTLTYPFLWGLANHICMNVLVSFIGGAPAAERSTAMGLFSFITYLAVGMGGAVYGAVYAQVGFMPVSFAAMLGMVLAAILVAGFLKKAVAPRSYETPSARMN
ncbi:MFS transporter [Dongia sp.]|uniref:MFS transporter n=1 Tax=Dongia sp. TaxID=1977262 RepID=UPI0035B4A0BB